MFHEVLTLVNYHHQNILGKIFTEWAHLLSFEMLDKKVHIRKKVNKTHD